MRNYFFLFLMLVACRQKISTVPTSTGKTDTTLFAGYGDTINRVMQNDTSLQAKIVAFAMTLKGLPYKYCSMDPDGGFDCSGFVNYVFNHFNIKVPRSSADFTYVGTDVPLNDAQPSDLILFTGTNPHKRVVGHIGIITTNDSGNIRFIQSTSGDAHSVVVSPLDKSYMQRFVKVIRIVK